MTAAPDPLLAIRQQVMWNRLIAVVEEQAQALLRTAFGSVVRESGDLSAGVYNQAGHMLAQAVTGTPGHVNSMAMAVRHFLDRYPLANMQPGDVYVTNDPWMGTGHLFDFVVVTPVFRDATPVALFASTCHTVDVGGIGFSADARSVFEEGVLIPHLKLRDRHRLNDDLLAIAMANSRNPVELRGDVLALVSSNDVGSARLLDMMVEFALTDIESLADHILASSERATLAAIAALPRGRFAYRMDLDGYDQPIVLHASLNVAEHGIDVDYAGSSAASPRGINSPICYTEAYSVFGLKCIIAPDVPNNAGSLRPFRVRAPEGSIVNPQRPSPVTARHVVGQMLADMMFGCLAGAVDGQVPAEGAGSLWVLAMAGQRATTSNIMGPRSNIMGPRYNIMGLGIGGMGARPTKDGLAVTAFPSGVGTTPLEILETDSPLVFLRKEFTPDSGGPGTHRGGLGQTIHVRNPENQPFTISAATFERRVFPAAGRRGGAPGSRGRLMLDDGTVFDGKGVFTVPPGATLLIELPGGGGFGDPAGRDPAMQALDIAEGKVGKVGLRPNPPGAEPLDLD